MFHMNTFLTRGQGWVAVALVVACVFAGVGIVQAATTISTNISTGGTLSVTGAATLSSTLAVTGASTLTGGATVGSSGTAITQVLFGTCTVTLGSITASTTAITTCTATGVTTSDKVFVTPYITNNGIFMVSASSTAADTIQIAVHNVGYTGAVNPDDNSWRWMAIR
jgi:fibronectin-binding autotransporter adhesin